MFLLHRRRGSERKVTVHCCVSNGMNSSQENSAATYPRNGIERSPLVQGLPRRDWPVCFEMFVAIIICLPVGRCVLRLKFSGIPAERRFLVFPAAILSRRCRRPLRFPSFLPSFLLPSLLRHARAKRARNRPISSGSFSSPFRGTEDM